MNCDYLIKGFLIIGLRKFFLFTCRGIPLPSPYEINTMYLKEEVTDAHAYVDSQRPIWQGCTIRSDGWTGPTRLSIVGVKNQLLKIFISIGL